MNGNTAGRSRAKSIAAPFAPEAVQAPLTRARPPQRTARGLGWFSLGLGLSELLAPGAIAELIGVRNTTPVRKTLRCLGARELLQGFGILSGRRTAAWVWSRAAGDLMDLSLLAWSFRSARPKKAKRIPMALLAVAGVTVLDAVAAARLSRRASERDKGEAGGPGKGEPIELTGAITIGRSPEEVYAFWRNFRNLSRFMANVESVQVEDQQRSRWTVNAAGRSVDWDATITEDRTGELIAWRTLHDAEVAHEGEVRFSTAPGNRGTSVTVKMRVHPPGGSLGRALSKLARPIPQQEIRNDLRRLKQVLEVGEIVHSDASLHRDMHPARPSRKQGA